MRTITEKILCDSCNVDISPKESAYPRQDILKVTCLNVRRSTGFTYALHMSPMLEHDLYFCGLTCMTNYEVKS